MKRKEKRRRDRWRKLTLICGLSDHRYLMSCFLLPLLTFHFRKKAFHSHIFFIDVRRMNGFFVFIFNFFSHMKCSNIVN